VTGLTGFFSAQRKSKNEKVTPSHDLHGELRGRNRCDPDLFIGEASLSAFERAIQYTVTNEGVCYTNRANDAGGPTKFGITLNTLRRWRQTQGSASSVDAHEVENLGLSEASQIYKALYWDEMGLDLIQDDAIAMAIFDIGVNSGPSTSVRLAQRVVGVAVDGKMGHGTADAINIFNKVKFFEGFISLVQHQYIADVVGNPTQIEFLNGWLARSQKLISLIG
jgi:lysozyme family protein